MGLPEINIEFKTKAETAVKRSQNGVVAVILFDKTKSDVSSTSYGYNLESDVVKSHWTTANYDYLNLIFKGTPKRVLVERIGVENEYDEALARLKNKNWDWLCIPNLESETKKIIADWIVMQRATHKPFKAVLPNYTANEMAIVNLTTDNFKVGTKTYTTAEYCCRFAGLFAGLSMLESATYQVLGEVDSITESTTPDADIDAGKLICINDGEKIKIARGVNSLSTLSGKQTEDMKKIKIIEAIDLIRSDIKTTFEDNYIGISGKYDNKMLFIGAVNQYFAGLEKSGVLYDEFDNIAYIDVEAIRSWLAEKYDVSEMTDEQIKKAKTGTRVFAGGNIQPCDAIEDLDFGINMN